MTEPPIDLTQLSDEKLEWYLDRNLEEIREAWSWNEGVAIEEAHKLITRDTLARYITGNAETILKPLLEIRTRLEKEKARRVALRTGLNTTLPT